MYMDLNLATLVEAAQENQEAHQQEEDLYQQQVPGQEVVQEIAPNLLLDRRHDGGDQGEAVADGVERVREHMFDKVVTPSDVGKLNRLVVPKQHAERYFPVAAAGTQLCFEDRAGIPWRFRYSYWGSSQSYVMTKGWSRFVRAARLSAGDTISFSRAGGRYFIDYRHCQRRRRDISFGDAVPAWPLFGRVQTAASWGSATMILDTVPVVAGHHVEVGPTGPRSFRLFGVNVECSGDEVGAAVEDEVVDGDHRGEERELVTWRNHR